MKLRRLLARVEAFLSAEERARVAQRDAMKGVLRKLKKKSRKLSEAIEETAQPDERERLEQKLQVVQAQRRKGLAALKALKQPSGDGAHPTAAAATDAATAVDGATPTADTGEAADSSAVEAAGTAAHADKAPGEQPSGPRSALDP